MELTRFQRRKLDEVLKNPMRSLSCKYLQLICPIYQNKQSEESGKELILQSDLHGLPNVY